MKNTFCGWLILLIAMPVYAEEVDKENFDRLFTSYAERQKLDSLRKNGLLYKKPSSDTVDENENKPAAKPRELKVSGIILRADGKAQVWLSGQPLYSSLKQLNSTKNTSSNLRVPEGKAISLKPGQVLINGKAKEAYYFVTQSSVASQAVVEPAQLVASSSVSSVASSSVSSRVSENAQSSSP